MKRYVITLDAYIYADTDEEAVNQAADLVKKMNKKYDNDADVVSLHEQPFGTFESRKIK